MNTNVEKYLYLAAKTASIIFHPLMLATYGFALLAAIGKLAPDNMLVGPYNAIAIAGTAIFTLFIPLSLILILKRQKRISSIELYVQRERRMPYIYTSASFAVWCYYVAVTLSQPPYIIAISVATTVAILCVAAINSRWKISAHATGIGTFTGAVMVAAADNGVLSNWLICTLFAITMLVIWARLYLRAHTAAQVIAGLLLGFSLSMAAIFFV